MKNEERRMKNEEVSSPPHSQFFILRSSILIFSLCPLCPCGSFLLELAQEPQVVPPVQSDVVDAVLQLGDALRPHAEREAAELLRVVAAVAQHHWMNHARPHDLQPAAALAQGAPLLPA